MRGKPCGGASQESTVGRYRCSDGRSRFPARVASKRAAQRGPRTKTAPTMAPTRAPPFHVCGRSASAAALSVAPTPRTPARRVPGSLSARPAPLQNPAPWPERTSRVGRAATQASGGFEQTAPVWKHAHARWKASEAPHRAPAWARTGWARARPARQRPATPRRAARRRSRCRGRAPAAGSRAGRCRHTRPRRGRPRARTPTRACTRWAAGPSRPRTVAGPARSRLPG